MAIKVITPCVHMCGPTRYLGSKNLLHPLLAVTWNLDWILNSEFSCQKCLRSRNCHMQTTWWWKIKPLCICPVLFCIYHNHFTIDRLQSYECVFIHSCYILQVGVPVSQGCNCNNNGQDSEQPVNSIQGVGGGIGCPTVCRPVCNNLQ